MGFENSRRVFYDVRKEFKRTLAVSALVGLTSGILAVASCGIQREPQIIEVPTPYEIPVPGSRDNHKEEDFEERKEEKPNIENPSIPEYKEIDKMDVDNKSYSQIDKISRNLAVKIIKKYEGFESKAYLCPAKVPTIGYGHTGGVRLGDKIDEIEGEKILYSDIETACNAVDRKIKVPLNIWQRAALISFTYNVGQENFGNSTLLTKLNSGDDSAAEEFKRWNKGGGKVLNGLIKRREDEENLFKREGKKYLPENDYVSGNF